jgi:hypothetical protein
MSSQQIIPYPVRLPPALRQFLAQQAIINHRSLNGEIVARLEQSRQAQRTSGDKGGRQS